jgi:hypothetical protein
MPRLPIVSRALVLLGLVGCEGPDLDRLEADSRCGDGGFRLCAGFEGFLDAPFKEQFDAEVAGITIDESFAYRGRGSLHAFAQRGQFAAAQIYNAGPQDDVSSLDWFRAFVYMADADAFEAELFWFVMNEPPHEGVVLSVEDGGHFYFKAWTELDYYRVPTSARFESGHWTCVEASVVPGRPIEVWLDGARVPGIDPAPTAVAADMTLVFAGPRHEGGAGPPAEVWLDELALADERIGCER